jgi:excisionase family DNA binding protein
VNVSETPGHGKERWLVPWQAAILWGVSPRTLRAWAAAGKIRAQKTLGGHRRYAESEISAIIAELAEVA